MSQTDRPPPSACSWDCNARIGLPESSGPASLDRQARAVREYFRILLLGKMASRSRAQEKEPARPIKTPNAGGSCRYRMRTSLHFTA